MWLHWDSFLLAVSTRHAQQRHLSSHLVLSTIIQHLGSWLMNVPPAWATSTCVDRPETTLFSLLTRSFAQFMATLQSLSVPGNIFVSLKQLILRPKSSIFIVIGTISLSQQAFAWMSAMKSAGISISGLLWLFPISPFFYPFLSYLVSYYSYLIIPILKR